MLEEIVKHAKQLAQVTQRTYQLVEADMKQAFKKGQDRIHNVIDNVTREEYLSRIGKAVYETAASGYEATRTAINGIMNEYDDKLNRLVKKRPDVVGFWDGFANAFTNSDCKRRPRSKAYSQHVKYGKATGFAVSIIALPFGVGGKAFR